jgi:hypothetical protein
MLDQKLEIESKNSERNYFSDLSVGSWHWKQVLVTRMFLGLPDPDKLVIGMDPDQAPALYSES